MAISYHFHSEVSRPKTIQIADIESRETRKRQHSTNECYMRIFAELVHYIVEL